MGLYNVLYLQSIASSQGNHHRYTGTTTGVENIGISLTEAL
jgi:hypothetical protein